MKEHEYLHNKSQPVEDVVSPSKRISVFRSQTFFLMVVIVILSVLFGTLNPRFLSQGNLLAVFQQIAVLGIATMSMTLLLISGGIDLSIGSMIGLSGVVICKMVMAGISPFWAILAGFLLPIGCGLINGVIVSKSKCVPLIVTLGMSYVYYGLALVISGGLFLSLRGHFTFLGRGRFLGIPVSVMVLFVVVLVVHFMLRNTKFGRRLVVMGGNEQVAFLSGINVDRLKIASYTLSGVLIGLASLVLISRLGNILANAGEGYELRALASAIIGGVTFEGGRGSVLGAFLGVVLLGIVQNGLNILNVSSYFQTFTVGLIIVVAVVVSNLEKLRRR
ncbi:ABC transporter permease [Thermatribacter velox]|uniref:ABC transporter permease n=1 Tax=Thermatribacter velox TaxID=3039681 RepID=A0ABZ2YB43_9BACT